MRVQLSTACLAIASLEIAACKFPPPPDVGDDDGADARTDGRTDAASQSCSPWLVVNTDEGTLYSVPLDGAPGTLLAASAFENRGASGTDKGFVVFDSPRTGLYQVYRVDNTGGAPQQLSQAPSSGIHPVAARDGAAIAYVRGMALWVMDASGNGSHQVAPGPLFSYRWSPDNAHLVFEASESLSESDLWTVRSDGSELRHITSLPGLESMTTWSPDGTQIAFVSGTDVFVVGIDGTNLHPLTQSSNIKKTPAWSPDGSLIAFEEGGDIRAVPAAGGAPVSLSSGPDADSDPRWSPDGGTLLYLRESVGGGTKVPVLATADGRMPMPRPTPAGHASAVDWVRCP